jgi:hypothetical protein
MRSRSLRNTLDGQMRFAGAMAKERIGSEAEQKLQGLYPDYFD